MSLFLQSFDQKCRPGHQLLGSLRESDVPGIPFCISKRPSQLVVTNKEEYETILKNISRKLCQDGIVFDFVLSSFLCNLPARISPPSDLENAIDKKFAERYGI